MGEGKSFGYDFKVIGKTIRNNSDKETIITITIVPKYAFVENGSERVQRSSVILSVFGLSNRRRFGRDTETGATSDVKV